MGKNVPGPITSQKVVPTVNPKLQERLKLLRIKKVLTAAMKKWLLANPPKNITNKQEAEYRQKVNKGSFAPLYEAMSEIYALKYKLIKISNTTQVNIDDVAIQKGIVNELATTIKQLSVPSSPSQSSVLEAAKFLKTAKQSHFIKLAHLK